MGGWHVDAFGRGDLAEARRRHAQLFPLCRALMGVAANPIPVKTALALLGRSTGELRLPLCPAAAPGREALRRSLDRHGLRIREDRPSESRRTRSHALPALETRDEP
ncbi:MAG: dihydrodipicolinate synthase family protein [Planctomycetaceae bacterium]|nr:dihydrodipicolinate synthase family protein [Planctomycetaceae bacterium]